MYSLGSVLYGLFDLIKEQKYKYSIVLYKEDNGDVILHSFTTSQPRAGLNPIHGANPDKTNPICHVFKAGNIVGKSPLGDDFSFPKDTTVVPDYGIHSTTISEFMTKVDDLSKRCQLNNEEFVELIYTLYKSKRTTLKYKKKLEEVLEKISSL